MKDVISLSKSPAMLDEIERRESHEGEVENMFRIFTSRPAAESYFAEGSVSSGDFLLF